VRHTWRLIYGTTLVGGAIGAALILSGVHTSDPTTAVAGLSLLFTSLMAFRTTYEQVCLRRARKALGNQERLLQAERGVWERDTERTRRELADQEHDQAEAIACEREALHRQLEEERDRMLIDFANKRAELQRAAFQKGFEMGENGIGKEPRSAEVIYLPFSGGRPTTMETGTMHR
jgi:hypothetical protein